jgi:hypothetical protein
MKMTFDEKKIREILLDKEIRELMAECWATRQEMRWLRNCADKLEWQMKEKEQKVAARHSLSFADLLSLEIMENHMFNAYMKGKWKNDTNTDARGS